MNQSDLVTAERDLVKRVKENKQEFLVIYETHFQRIYNYAYFRTMDTNEAEEITSQTFLAALESIENFEYRDVPLAVWLYKIASNALTDLYRRKGKSVELTEEHACLDFNCEPEQVFLGKTEKEQLLQQLNNLPESQQQAIFLRYMHNFSHKEIAQIMDKTEGAVKQLLHRGLTYLRERMVRYV